MQEAAISACSDEVPDVLPEEDCPDAKLGTIRNMNSDTGFRNYGLGFRARECCPIMAMQMDKKMCILDPYFDSLVRRLNQNVTTWFQHLVLWLKAVVFHGFEFWSGI